MSKKTKRILIFVLAGCLLIVYSIIAETRRHARIEESRFQFTRHAIQFTCQQIQKYKAIHSKLPDTLTQLMFNDGATDTLSTTGQLGDGWGTLLQYTKIGEDSFEVRSAGPDKIMGTEDDITN